MMVTLSASSLQVKRTGIVKIIFPINSARSLLLVVKKCNMLVSVKLSRHAIAYNAPNASKCFTFHAYAYKCRAEYF